jgi:hypothetical protein
MYRHSYRLSLSHITEGERRATFQTNPMFARVGPAPRSRSGIATARLQRFRTHEDQTSSAPSTGYRHTAIKDVWLIYGRQVGAYCL